MECFIYYSEVLGMDTELINEEIIHLKAPASSPVVIYYKADHQPANFTVLNIQVKGIRTIVEQLLAKGEKFDKPGTDFRQTYAEDVLVNLNNSLVAWTKDPGGNIIALIEG
ncbi:MAG: VOC family protein [Cyclobacteriaceae bacterium]